MTLLGLFISLVIAWTCSMLAGVFFGGKTENPLPTPCYFIGKFLVWRISIIPFYISIAIFVGLFVGFTLPGIVGTVCGGIILATLSFLPFQLLDFIKRGSDDTASSKTKVIHTSSSIKQGSQLALYIEEEDWKSINNLAEKDRTYLEQFRIGGSLFVAPATNVVLQIIDSYGLIRFLLTSEHQKALQRIASSLQETEGAPLPAVPFIQPKEIKNQITPPKQKDLEEEEDDDFDDDDFDDKDLDSDAKWPENKIPGADAFKIPDFIPPQPKVTPAPKADFSDEDDDDLDDITDEDIRKFLAELEAEDKEDEGKDKK